MDVQFLSLLTSACVELSGSSHDYAASALGKERQVTIEQEAARAQSRHGRCGKEINTYLVPAGNQTTFSRTSST